MLNGNVTSIVICGGLRLILVNSVTVVSADIIG